MRRASGIVGIALAGLLIAACAPTDRVSVTIDDVAAERAALSEARVDRLLQSYGDYLLSRWPGLELPSTEIERWTELGEWPLAFGSCASELSGLTVRTDLAAGVFALPPPRDDVELLAFETSIYVCQGRFPPPGLARNDPGPREQAWINDYVTVQWPACVRRLGLAVQPPGAADGRPLAEGSIRDPDPYAAVRRDEAELVRVYRVCPPPETVLSMLTAAGEKR